MWIFAVLEEACSWAESSLTGASLFPNFDGGPCFAGTNCGVSKRMELIKAVLSKARLETWSFFWLHQEATWSRSWKLAANDQSRAFEDGNDSQDKFRTDAGLRLKPLSMWKFRACLHGLGQRQVKFLCESVKACPSSVSEKKESGKHSAVPKNPRGRVFLGGMVIMCGAPGNLFPGLAVKGVVKRNQQTTSYRGNRNHSCQKFSQRVPRELAGIEEVVEFFKRGASRKQNCESSENIAGAPRTSAGTKRWE